MSFTTSTIIGHHWVFLWQVSELEALNFALEEQLIGVSSSEGEGGGADEVDGGGGGGERRRRRAYTLLESTLGEKDKVSQTMERNSLAVAEVPTV